VFITLITSFNKISPKLRVDKLVLKKAASKSSLSFKDEIVVRMYKTKSEEEVDSFLFKL
jgi:hypothetical protein